MFRGGRGSGTPHPVGGPYNDDTATLAACPIPHPRPSRPSQPFILPPSPAHLPSPTLPSYSSPTPIFPVVVALPNTGPLLPCVAHATSLSSRLVLTSRSEEWEGTHSGPIKWRRGGVVGRPFQS